MFRRERGRGAAEIKYFMVCEIFNLRSYVKESIFGKRHEEGGMKSRMKSNKQEEMCLKCLYSVKRKNIKRSDLW